MHKQLHTVSVYSVLLQTKAGRRPEGHCAQEFQEYLRLVVIPKCQLLSQYFENPKTSQAYNRMKNDLDWSDEDGQCFMLALDKDRRHSMTDMVYWRQCLNGTGTGQARDRRNVEKGEEGWIALSEKQIVPAGPKQCDTIQAPVEMVMSQIKRGARALLPAVGQRSGMLLFNAVREAAESVSGEKVKAYWMHALKAIRVWSAPCDTVIPVLLSRNNYREPYMFKGTHGGVVPKLLRG